MAQIKVQAADIVELATEIAEYMYGILPSFPEEERWHSAAKIRTATVDLMFYVAQSAAGDGVAVYEHDWRYAGKNVKALKTIYKFAGRQNFIKIDPEIMLKLDEAYEIIETELKKAQKSTAEALDRELEPWMKKYKIWKEIQA